MRRSIPVLACLAVFAVLGGLGASVALAAGSAAGSQYTDPLSTPTPSSSGSGSGSSSSSGSGSSSGSQSASSSSSSSSASLSASGPSGSTASSGTSTTSTSSSGSSASGSGGHTLPFTGLNVWALLAAACGMLGSGLILRFTLRRAW